MSAEKESDLPPTTSGSDQTEESPSLLQGPTIITIHIVDRAVEDLGH